MKVISLRLALPAILAIVFAAAGRADAAEKASSSRRGLQAKIEYCKDCHGLSAQGYRGYYIMPRLAGQQTEYLENQLRAFLERRRENKIMANVAHGLSPEMRPALAAHFKDLNPAPFGGAPRHLVATGKNIYEEGVPEANIPACLACHGPEAKGQGPIPRLAGQLYWYLINVLTHWGQERGQGPTKDESAIMLPITHNLTQSQVETIAAYLSYLK